MRKRDRHRERSKAAVFSEISIRKYIGHYMTYFRMLIDFFPKNEYTIIKTCREAIPWLT